MAARPSSLHSSPPVYASVPISTLPLYRRLLFPSLPPATPTPPIFVHGTQELDTATYTLLALILRNHVTPWYSRLTRDKTFLPQVAQVIVHVLQEVERRAVAADLAGLVYTTLPALIQQHYMDYRSARLRHALSPSTALSEAFHALQPHIALSPSSPSINPEYLRQAVEQVLRLTLPKEDWEAETERTIVREVIVGPVLGGVLPRLAQPWFLYGILLALVGRGKAEVGTSKDNTSKPPITSMRHMLVLLIGALHSLTSALHSVVTLMQSLSRFLATLPPRKQSPPEPRYHASNLLVLLSAMLDLSSRLVSGLLVSYLSILVALLQPLLDRILTHLLPSLLLTPPSLTAIVLRLTLILYPNGLPAPPTIEPSPEEQQRTLSLLQSRLTGLLPLPVGGVLLGPTTEARALTAKEVLEPLSNANCNTHLLMRLLDAILLCLFPELAAEGAPSASASLVAPTEGVKKKTVTVVIPSSGEEGKGEEGKSESEEDSFKQGFATPLSH